MKKTFLFILSLVLSSIAFGQYNINGVSDITDKARYTQQNVKVNNFDRNASRKAKFNVFLNENWQGGVMFSKDSINLNGFTYR
ncbi:MAG TPA: hypothetical protein P5132_06100, partial [Bacteroidales bacterium]|nr:hypothetical protein [Bacteroidales bacterium]